MPRLVGLFVLLMATLLLSCRSEPPTSRLQAFRVTDREQIFGGGPRALGDVGDYVIMNDQIRVVIQNAGYSRGFGVYGGGVIDADLRRPDEQGRGTSVSAGGHDIFAEMFPSFFFQAMACDKVEVLSDGAHAVDQHYGTHTLHYDAGTAVIRASGPGGEFLTMLRLFDSIFLNYLVPARQISSDGNTELIKVGLFLYEAFTTFAVDIAHLLNTNERFEVDYLLKPGDRHLQIRSRMINQSQVPIPIPSALLANSTFQSRLGGTDLSTLRAPMGLVMLYGRLNDVWLPGVGFDLRHPLTRSFKRNLALPAFNGIVSEFIASAAHRLGDRVSYGLVAEPSPDNFVFRSADAYRHGGRYQDSWTPIDDTSLLVPFTAISFIGVFTHSVKATLPPGEYVEMAQDFIIGNGDVASIVDEIARIRGTITGSYGGILRDAQSGQPIGDGQILIYQELAIKSDQFASDDDYLDAGLRRCGTASPSTLCRPYSQSFPDDNGNFLGNLPPGRYAYRAQGQGRPLGPFVPFVVTAASKTDLGPTLPPPSWVQAFVSDESGRPIPAKVSLVGQYDRAYSDAERRSGAVFDLQAGEDYRFTDMLDDHVDGQRAFIEQSGYSDGGGQALLSARPGDYTAYFSRGFEYNLVGVPVQVAAGSGASASAQLTRVVDTTGWLSMDAHLHDEDSIDSSMNVVDRLVSAAGEGVELAISTNHNFVSDWRPWVDGLGLNLWMASFVGIEFTTLESGHFNSFPLAYEVGPVTHGSFNWFGSPPQQLLTGLRQLADGENVVECNHPRDANMGYFNQYGRSSLTGAPIAWGTSKRLAGANGSAFFDANGNNTIDYGCDAYEIVNGKLQHELHGFRVPTNWPSACYQPLPSSFDPKTQIDPCNLDGKVLRPPGESEALAPGTLLLTHTASADPGPGGLDNAEAAFPGAIDDWFHLINQGYRATGLANSDSHASVGEEPGAPRTFLYFGQDEPFGIANADLVRVVKARHAATLSHGPFLTFTVEETGNGTSPTMIGGELGAPSGNVTVRYKLAAPPWVSVSRISIYVNGLITNSVRVDPARNLADRGGAPLTDELALKLTKDSWIVLEAAGERPMFPVVTGTEEPFLLISDAVGALAGPLGITASTDISVVVVGNEQPHALTNPVWVRVGTGTWQPPGVQPFSAINDPAQDPHVGVLRTHN
jgi:hypothetical protein